MFSDAVDVGKELLWLLPCVVVAMYVLVWAAHFPKGR